MAIRGKDITITIRAIDVTTNLGKTGDAANISMQVIKDGTAAASVNSVAEVSAANAPGVYSLALSFLETVADMVSVQGKSSTANVRIDGWQDAFIRVPDANPGANGGIMISGANTGPWTVSSGVTFSNSGGDAFTAISTGGNGCVFTSSHSGSIGFSAAQTAGGDAVKFASSGGSGNGLTITTSGGSGNAIDLSGSGGTNYAIHMGNDVIGANITLSGNLTASHFVGIVNDLSVTAYGESLAVPAASDTIERKIAWLGTQARDELVTDIGAGTVTVAADGGAIIGTSTISDTGTVATRGKFV